MLELQVYKQIYGSRMTKFVFALHPRNLCLIPLDMQYSISLTVTLVYAESP